MKLFVMVILLLSSLKCQNTPSNNSKFDYPAYLETRFNYKISQNTRIKYKTKQEVIDGLLERIGSSDDKAITRAHTLVSKTWPSSLTEFIDTLYTVDKDDSTVLNGLWLHCLGDSTSYIAGIYKNGNKDSTWINKSSNGKIKFTNYKDGKKEGLQIINYPAPDKGKSVTMYRNDMPVDTGYLYDSLDNILVLSIFKDGDLFEEHCFKEDGTEWDCDEADMQ